jgi:hypothetical protein
VNSSHGLKAGASLLLLRFYAVIALWHRGAFRGNFRFRFIGPNLHQIRNAEVQISSDRFGVFPPYSVESSGEFKISPREK